LDTENAVTMSVHRSFRQREARKRTERAAIARQLRGYYVPILAMAVPNSLNFLIKQLSAVETRARTLTEPNRLARGDKPRADTMGGGRRGLGYGALIAMAREPRDRDEAMREQKTNADRLAAFSDAVIPVIITIMVLELRAPEEPTFVDRAHASSLGSYGHVRRNLCLREHRLSRVRAASARSGGRRVSIAAGEAYDDASILCHTVDLCERHGGVCVCAALRLCPDLLRLAALPDAGGARRAPMETGPQLIVAGHGKQAPNPAVRCNRSIRLGAVTIRAPRRNAMTAIKYRSADVAGVKVFYREAGAADAPTLLLLHGFPSASHMFRDLIPLLADRFHIVAPDLPGFGQSGMPARTKFKYTFDHIAAVIDRFTEVIGLKRFAIYVFDYGAPIGFRIAAKHPDRITAIISQNGNAYEEGLSDGWNPIRAYWQEPSQANRDALRAFLAPEATRWQYTHGVTDATTVSPDGQSLDNFYLARPGADEVQLDLFSDYKSNVVLYLTFQSYFRTHEPPFLAVWGKNDPFFLPPGAEAFKRDLPDAVVRFFDTGHFALETHAAEIAAAIRDFLPS
jgi:pimeloyl-ACP methyl ester carboxylesterase